MPVNVHLKKTLIPTALILIGLFIAFKVWWTPSQARFLGMIAFFMVTFGCLFLSMSLTKLFIGRNLDFDFYTFTDKASLIAFKKKNGQKVTTKISTMVTCIFLPLFGAVIFIILKVVNGYESKQLSTYGIRQKVMIKDVIYKGKGSNYAVFDFFIENKKYSNDLSNKSYTTGDSAEIIFSSQNPDIIKWAEDFTDE